MKRKSGKLLIVTGVCALLAVSLIAALAGKSKSEIIAADSVVQGQIQPHVNGSGTVYLAANQWCNVTSSNNVFPYKPKITNDASNPCYIKLRIVNEVGEVVGKEKEVEAGKSVTMDNIPAFSGTYTLQAYSEKEGNFTISID